MAPLLQVSCLALCGTPGRLCRKGQGALQRAVVGGMLLGHNIQGSQEWIICEARNGLARTRPPGLSSSTHPCSWFLAPVSVGRWSREQSAVGSGASLVIADGCVALHSLCSGSSGQGEKPQQELPHGALVAFLLLPH